MIAYLEGRVGQVFEHGCLVITAGGVGYEVGLPTHTLAALSAPGEAVCLYTITVVREDALELYGFSSWDERQTFLVLTSISKVGAKTATAILSVFRPDDLRRLVLDDDYALLTQVPGIGRKTAQHIFLELKYKLDAGPADMAALTGKNAGGVFADALTGLTNLGYDETEAGQALKAVLAAEPDLDVTAALRAALKALGKKRG